ncbi:MAG: penicillin-binding transpeptidase domain-containing protein, partial [Pseudobdellovibrionaceae bacterium]
VKIPPYISVGQIVEGVVTEINDVRGFVLVQAPEMLGAIDFQTMKWARKPNFEKSYEQDTIRKPSDALKVGDVILVKVINDQFQLSDVSKNKKDKPMTFPGRVTLNLEQEPKVEGALVSFDLKTQELLALVGGFDFQRNEFNRALQAARQTGSSFKALVYAAALDHGYTASTPIMDTPIVFEQKEIDEGQEATKLWRPSNHGRDYSGDITFRNALVRSLNIPTVKIIEDIGVKYSTDYARRLGIFSSLNQDFTMSLGTSSVTLYEMTKAFSVFGRLGKRIKPIIIHKVIDQNNKQILGETSLDIRYKNEIDPIEEEFVTRRKSFFESMSNGASDETVNENSQSDGKTSVETKKPIKDEMFFLPDEEQAIKPQTAYLITSLLKGAVEDPHGTGGKARALGREVAGKTGTSQGYFDAWFLGYTAQISTGVWVGFDKEHTIGRGEVGGRSALPIWVEYMQEAHKKLPIANIPVPDGITFVSIDADTGKLASSKSKNVIKQAFLEGTEPNLLNNKEEETSDFLKQDLTE